MKKSNVKEILIPTLTLFVICLIVAALLALTNNLTKEPIAQQNEKTMMQSMKSVCPDADSFDEVKTDNDKASLYKALDKDKNVIGYAVSTSAKGYGGSIGVMTGIANGEIIAVNVYDTSNETPGLGTNTSKDMFTDGFKGDISKEFAVKKDAKGEQKSVDAVTGATISSRAVVKAVNEAVSLYNEFGKEEAGAANGDSSSAVLITDDGGEM